MFSGVVIIRDIYPQMGFPKALVSRMDDKPMTNDFENLCLSMYRDLPQKWNP